MIGVEKIMSDEVKFDWQESCLHCIWSYRRKKNGEQTEVWVCEQAGEKCSNIKNCLNSKPETAKQIDGKRSTGERALELVRELLAQEPVECDHFDDKHYVFCGAEKFTEINHAKDCIITRAKQLIEEVG
jgi:hypothetical protein